MIFDQAAFVHLLDQVIDGGGHAASLPCAGRAPPEILI
jgi:hypothetical protein